MYIQMQSKGTWPISKHKPETKAALCCPLRQAQAWSFPHVMCQVHGHRCAADSHVYSDRHCLSLQNTQWEMETLLSLNPKSGSNESTVHGTMNLSQGTYLNPLKVNSIALIAISESTVEGAQETTRNRIRCVFFVYGGEAGRMGMSTDCDQKWLEHSQAPFTTWREHHNS